MSATVPLNQDSVLYGCLAACYMGQNPCPADVMHLCRGTKYVFIAKRIRSVLSAAAVAAIKFFLSTFSSVDEFVFICLLHNV